MSISQHGNIITATGTPYATDGIETLALSSAAASGDLIVALAGCTSSARDITITDDRSGASHTYSPGPTGEQASQCECWMYFTVCNAAVSNVTFTLSASLGSPGWAAVFVLRATNGWDATVLGDSDSTLKVLGASPAQTAATGFTTTAASSAVVAAFNPIVNETWNDPVGVDSDAANCTNLIRYDAGGAGAAAAYQILSATKTNYSISFGYSSGNAEGPLLIAEFQEAAGGGGGTVGPLMGGHLLGRGILGGRLIN